MPPPNPRVQRTRPCASLRGSPQTRHPLGGPRTSEQVLGRASTAAARWLNGQGRQQSSGVGEIILVSLKATD